MLHCRSKYSWKGWKYQARCKPQRKLCHWNSFSYKKWLRRSCCGVVSGRWQTLHLNESRKMVRLNWCLTWLNFTFCKYFITRWMPFRRVLTAWAFRSSFICLSKNLSKWLCKNERIRSVVRSLAVILIWIWFNYSHQANFGWRMWCEQERKSKR